jgi:mycothiol synthase
MDTTLRTANRLLDTSLCLRPAEWSDAEAVASLIHDACIAQGDAARALTPEEVKFGWRATGFNMEKDTFVVETAGGRIVGYEEITNSYGYAVLDMDGYIHPDYRGRGIGTTLLRSVERRARELMAFAEPDVRVSIRTTISRDEPNGIALHENEGYHSTRYHWRMEILLDGAPAEPRWPDGIELRPFRQMEHELAVWHANNEAGREEPGSHAWSLDQWREYRFDDPEYDPSLWAIAWAGDEVAGYSLNRDRTSMGWIQAVGVRPQWRKRGIAQALLRHSFAEFHRRGMRTVGLGVDSYSPKGAHRLYERVGMHPVSASVMYEKELRAGRDPNRVSTVA